MLKCQKKWLELFLKKFLLCTFRNNVESETVLYLTNGRKRGPIRSSLDVSFSSPTTVDKHTKISSEEISDGREYSLLFLCAKVEVSC